MDLLLIGLPLVLLPKSQMFYLYDKGYSMLQINFHFETDVFDLEYNGT